MFECANFTYSKIYFFRNIARLLRKDIGGYIWFIANRSVMRNINLEKTMISICNEENSCSMKSTLKSFDRRSKVLKFEKNRLLIIMLFDNVSRKSLE